ncbi:MAG: hypothetical protein AB7I50_23560 [Vicinamibacterales bacterium]
MEKQDVRAVNKALFEMCKGPKYLTVGEFIESLTAFARIARIDKIIGALEGIWCGSEGRALCDIEGTQMALCVGWYNGRVEYAYLS